MNYNVKQEELKKSELSTKAKTRKYEKKKTIKKYHKDKNKNFTYILINHSCNTE